MYQVAVVGHSLVPESVEGPGLDFHVFRKPGGKWEDFWGPRFSVVRRGGFDLVILVFGGNDLAGTRPVNSIIEEAKSVIRCAKGCARNVRVCLAETRKYNERNRFNVVNEEYKRRRNKYNRTMRRLLNREHVRHIDLGKPWYANERTSDGVHFNAEAVESFKREIVRVSLGVKASVV